MAEHCHIIRFGDFEAHSVPVDDGDGVAEVFGEGRIVGGVRSPGAVGFAEDAEPEPLWGLNGAERRAVYGSLVDVA